MKTYLQENTDRFIYIAIWLHGKGWIPAGAVMFNDVAGYAGFSYFESYIKNNYPPLNPATLNYRDTNNRHFMVDPRINNQMLDRTFWELLPTTGDFGHQTLISHFPQYSNLNYAQKLYFLGNRIVGGLASYVKSINEEESINSPDWLDEIRRDAVGFYLKDIQRMKLNKDSFLAMTSYGGVRPKAMYKDENNKYWIAKFNLPTDPYDMAIAEHVAISMVRASGLKTPDTKVITLPSGENVFLTERFDRTQSDRFHSLALYSLAQGVDNPVKPNGPKGNMSAIMSTIIRRYSDFKSQDNANLVLKLLLDIGLNNTDNHLRNTRIILNKEYKWEISPIFDVVFNPRSQPHIYNPAGLELSATYLENEKLAEGMAEQSKLPVDQIQQLQKNVLKTVNDWETFCDAANMNADDKMRIKSAISLGTSRMEIDYRLKQDQRLKLEKALKHMPKLK